MRERERERGSEREGQRERERDPRVCACFMLARVRIAHTLFTVQRERER